MIFLRTLIVAFIVTGILDLLAKKSKRKTASSKKICRKSSARFCRIGNHSNDNSHWCLGVC